MRMHWVRDTDLTDSERAELAAIRARNSVHGYANLSSEPHQPPASRRHIGKWLHRSRIAVNGLTQGLRPTGDLIGARASADLAAADALSHRDGVHRAYRVGIAKSKHVVHLGTLAKRIKGKGVKTSAVRLALRTAAMSGRQLERGLATRYATTLCLTYGFDPYTPAERSIRRQLAGKARPPVTEQEARAAAIGHDLDSLIASDPAECLRRIDDFYRERFLLRRSGAKH